MRASWNPARVMASRSVLSCIVLLGVVGAKLVLPRVDFESLTQNDPGAASAALSALRDYGLLSVDGVPMLGSFRKLALSSVGDCLAGEARAPVAALADGVERRTVGWRSGGSNRDASLDSDCGADALPLRLSVDAVGSVLFAALDRARDVSSFIMEREGGGPGYASYAELFGLGEQLEHMHAYYPKKKQSDSNTLDLHTDAGMLLATVRGLEEEDDLESPSQFQVDLGDGLLVEVRADEDSVLFVVGDGGANWVSSEEAGWRAVPHRLKVNRKRAWYGRMYFPVGDALVASSGLSVEKHLLAAQSDAADSTDLVGCGTGPRATPIDYLPTFMTDEVSRRLGGVSTEFCRTGSGATGLVCWLQCVSIEKLSCSADEMACVDTKSDNAVDGSVHCPEHGECEPKCLASAGSSGSNSSSNSSSSFSIDGNGGFCFGNGYSMHMDGFRSVFEKHRPGCINLLFINWTLETQSKFSVGVIVVVLLGILSEGMTAFRRGLYNEQQRRRQGGKRRSKSHLFLLRFTPECCSSDLSLQLLMYLLYFIQTLAAYALMLAAMTYSVELFAAACVGLTVGHIIFNFKTRPTNTEPCCAFQDAETKDENADDDSSSETTASALQQHSPTKRLLDSTDGENSIDGGGRASTRATPEEQSCCTRATPEESC